MDPCPNCDAQDSDPHEPGECLLGSPTPGDDRRAFLKMQRPGQDSTGAPVVSDLGSLDGDRDHVPAA